MSKLKLICILSFTTLFTGCFDLFNQTPNLPSRSTTNQRVIKKEQSIRGVIEDISYTENGWCYDIRSVDTSNDKLSSGKFCADKHYFNAGDLIYATIFDTKIKNMYLIQQGYVSPKKSYKNLNTSTKIQQTKRATNKKQVVELPKDEKINFD